MIYGAWAVHKAQPRSKHTPLLQESCANPLEQHNNEPSWLFLNMVVRSHDVASTKSGTIGQRSQVESHTCNYLTKVGLESDPALQSSDTRCRWTSKKRWRLLPLALAAAETLGQKTYRLGNVARCDLQKDCAATALTLRAGMAMDEISS